MFKFIIILLTIFFILVFVFGLFLIYQYTPMDKPTILGMDLDEISIQVETPIPGVIVIIISGIMLYSLLKKAEIYEYTDNSKTKYEFIEKENQIIQTQNLDEENTEPVTNKINENDYSESIETLEEIKNLFMDNNKNITEKTLKSIPLIIYLILKITKKK